MCCHMAIYQLRRKLVTWGLENKYEHVGGHWNTASCFSNEYPLCLLFCWNAEFMQAPRNSGFPKPMQSDFLGALHLGPPFFSFFPLKCKPLYPQSREVHIFWTGEITHFFKRQNIKNSEMAWRPLHQMSPWILVKNTNYMDILNFNLYGKNWGTWGRKPGTLNFKGAFQVKVYW